MRSILLSAFGFGIWRIYFYTDDGAYSLLRPFGSSLCCSFLWKEELNMEKDIQILILDLGSQYTQIIRRSLRYLGFHSAIVHPEKSLEWIGKNRPKGIILSGGRAGVYDADAPKVPKKLLDLNIPILGICFGMQWLAYVHDKNTIHRVKEGKSYGPVEVNFDKKKSKLFQGLGEKIQAWASHGDSVR